MLGSVSTNADAALTYQAVFPAEVGFSVTPVIDERDLGRDNCSAMPRRHGVVLSEVEKIGKYFPAHVPGLATRAERQEPIVRQRAGVVIVREGKVALIRREHANGKVYYLFPGGGVEAGERLEQAAVREAREELGLNVRLDGIAAVVSHNGSEQVYFFAKVESGEFGTGTGDEMSSARGSERGSYTAVMVDVHQLRGFDVRPRALAAALVDGTLTFGREPLRFGGNRIRRLLS